MISKLTLKDPTLLRDSCPLAGEWVAAENGGTIAVDNPSTGAVVGHVPNMGAAETRRAIGFANATLPAWACPDRERARRDPATLVQSDDGKPGTISVRS
jgi:succinate-semialdehyde dehydrogenase / glutarate-semialdehyde dehydrogenase